jgi:hypothetical protein
MGSQAVSTNVQEFEQFIITPIPASRVTWEVFGTPEYTGGIPGPTDFVTLVAELVPTAGWENPFLPGRVQGLMVTPEAPRQWLSDEFKALLSKFKNRDIDLPERYGCSSFDAKLRSSSRIVHGFLCPNKASILIYLVLREPS